MGNSIVFSCNYREITHELILVWPIEHSSICSHISLWLINVPKICGNFAITLNTLHLDKAFAVIFVIKKSFLRNPTLPCDVIRFFCVFIDYVIISAQTYDGWRVVGFSLLSTLTSGRWSVIDFKRKVRAKRSSWTRDCQAKVSCIIF